MSSHTTMPKSPNTDRQTKAKTVNPMIVAAYSRAISEMTLLVISLAAVFGHIRQWSRDGSLMRPAAFQSLRQSLFIDSVFVAPFRRCFCDACNGDHAIAQLVSVLFSLRGPTTVTRLVVPVFVWVAINRMFRRGFRTHVCHEIGKGMTPTIAHTNTTRPIAKIITRARIVATGLNGRPRRVFAGYGLFVAWHQSDFTLAGVI